jgi:hypothetical protein
MLKWLVELFKGVAYRGSPSPDSERLSMLKERRRLAEILASYEEFGFDAESEGCKDRLRRIEGRIRDLRGRPETPPAAPRRGSE